MAQQLDLSAEDFDANDYRDRTRQRHQPLILKFYGFRAFDPKAQFCGRYWLTQNFVG